MSATSLQSLGPVNSTRRYSHNQLYSLRGSLNTVKRAEELAQKVLPGEFGKAIVQTLREWNPEESPEMLLVVVTEWIQSNVTLNDDHQSYACEIFFRDQEVAALAKVLLGPEAPDDSKYQYDLTNHIWKAQV